MKKIIISLFAIFNKIWLILLSNSTTKFSGSSFFRVVYHIEKNNKVQIIHTNISKTMVSVIGCDNSIECNHSLIHSCKLSIAGKNNRILIGENVKLRQAEIIIRGDNCILEIGNRTTFGGIRIINVGTNNKISIGEDGLFSDKIELWASDTHPIYDENGVLINTEKPIIIGNNVWVGSRVIILKGVTVHDGSVIGMGALVTKDVPPNSISVGNPNRILKENISWSLEPK